MDPKGKCDSLAAMYLIAVTCCMPPTILTLKNVVDLAQTSFSFHVVTYIHVQDHVLIPDTLVTVKWKGEKEVHRQCNQLLRES